MKLLTPFIAAYRMPVSDKLLFLEAVVTSAYVRFSLSFLPFKKVAGWLGKANITGVPENMPVASLEPAASLEIVRKVQQAVRRCDRYTPWKTECYTQALTGKILLQRRYIPSTLYIGFKKDDQAKYKGHAWLKVEECFVTGYNRQLPQFYIHAFFS